MRPRLLVPALLLAAAAACREDAKPLDGAAVRGATPAAVSSAVLATSNGAPSAAPFLPPTTDRARLPRPYRNRGLEALEANAACVSCHADIAREWRGSRHQRATTNPAYLAALALEPSAFCRGCHAPEANPNAAAPKAMRDLGVGCVTCHVNEDGAVLGAPREGRAAHDGESTAAHLVERSASFAGSAACVSCHEFPFSTPGGFEDGHMMQTTIREHARGPLAQTPCASCHMPMPRGGANDAGRRGHGFENVRDPAFLRASLLADAEPLGEPGVRLTLRQATPAHGFPTGDLFRRLEVGVRAQRPDGTVIAHTERYLARHFVMQQGRPGRTLAADDRVFAEPLALELSLGLEDDPKSLKGVRISWWVTYQRAATVGMGDDPRKAKLESTVPLRSGSFLWETKP